MGVVRPADTHLGQKVNTNRATASPPGVSSGQRFPAPRSPIAASAESSAPSQSNEHLTKLMNHSDEEQIEE